MYIDIHLNHIQNFEKHLQKIHGYDQYVNLQYYLNMLVYVHSSYAFYIRVRSP